MSDRECNYCTWQRLKERGYRIATPKERLVWDKPGQPLSGTGVVIVSQKGKFARWFMELPNHCCC